MCDKRTPAYVIRGVRNRERFFAPFLLPGGESWRGIFARTIRMKMKGSERVALKGKAERFCEEYIIDYKQTEAAIRAGYPEKSARTQAWRLLKNATVAARVRELQHEYNETRCYGEKDRYNAELWKTYEWAKENGDERTVCKILELIGKANGMFTDNIEHKFGEGGGIDINVSVMDG